MTSIRIFEQGDGRYAVWSTVVETLLLENATEEEVREWYIEKRIEQAERDIEQRLQRAGEPYEPDDGPGTYEEAKRHHQ